MSKSEKGKMGGLLKANKLTGTHSSGTKRHYLDTGYPPLNKIVSGDHKLGLPSGQVVMIAGPSGCGKTMISTQMMISAQKQEGFAAFFDFETQYQEELAVKQGLDTDEEKYVYYKPETFEDAITDSIALAKLIRENDVIPADAPIVFVFDSLVRMTPRSKLLSMRTKGALSMHDGYALSVATNAWFGDMQREYDRYGVTSIFLNQVRVKLDSYGNEVYTYPGGDTPWYTCSTVIVLTAKDVFDGGKGSAKTLIKKDIKAQTRKSRNTMPMQTVHWDFVFKPDPRDASKIIGDFDVIGSYTEYLLDIGAIETAGAWIKFMGKSIQGRDKVISYFRDQTNGLEQLIAIHDGHNAKLVAAATATPATATE